MDERPVRRLSQLQHIQVGVMIFFMGLQLTLPYTISVYMVRNFFKGEGHSEQKIAQLTGVLAASQSFFRSFSAYGWGILVDKLGRKIGPLAGILGCIISLLGYGAASNYTQALLARSIPALLISGCPVAMKAMIGDACDEKGQAIALGVFNLGHGLGSVIGPLLGGAFAYPCNRFADLPFCDKGQLLEARPFLLPCLVASFVGVIAFVITCLLFKETHPELSLRPGGWKANFMEVICCRKRKNSYSAIQEGEETPEEAEQRLLQTRNSLGNLSSSNTLEKRESDIEMGRIKSGVSQNERIQKMPSETIPEDIYGMSELMDRKHQDNSKSSPDRTNTMSEEKTPNEDSKWWKDRDTQLALIGSGLAAFFFNFLDEMAPIYVSAPVKEGGLAMPLQQFTWPLASAGIFLVLFSLLFYPWMIEKYSPKVLCQFGMIGLAPMAIMLPLASLIKSNYIVQQILVYFSMILLQVPKICAMGSSMVVLNLVASKSAMGRVNGAGVTLQSAGRALGPTLSGSIWAISVSLHIYGQQFLGFIVCLIGGVASQFVFAVINVPSSQF